MLSEVSYDFGYGEVFTHAVFRADQIDAAKDIPGLYAWFVRTPQSAATEDLCGPFRRVHADRAFKIKATAPLGETIVGKIKRGVAAVKPPKSGETLDGALFASAFAAFSPPVYVGRSRTVKSRLGQHVKSLTKALATTDLGPVPREPELPDTDEESSQFGVRMGRLLKTQGIEDTRSLFVKIVYAETNEATKRVELMLNRTFHPVLGRL
ncbi:MAG: hypothetical protein EON90_00490 [Brevundimonas sp.]|nr:MAG: hypothetical protein EON90_00490 [Brevundimonas sp.]